MRTEKPLTYSSENPMVLYIIPIILITIISCFVSSALIVAHQQIRN